MPAKKANNLQIDAWGCGLGFRVSRFSVITSEPSLIFLEEAEDKHFVGSGSTQLALLVWPNYTPVPSTNNVSIKGFGFTSHVYVYIHMHMYVYTYVYIYIYIQAVTITWVQGSISKGSIKGAAHLKHIPTSI